jgi:hypothetical protein
MKKLLLGLMILVSGCEGDRDFYGLQRGGGLTSCGVSVSNSMVLVAIEDFKFSAGNEREIGYFFFVANKSDGLITYEGAVVVRGRGFSKEIPIMGVLKGGERKEISGSKVDMGQRIRDIEVSVRVEGTQVRE